MAPLWCPVPTLGPCPTTWRLEYHIPPTPPVPFPPQQLSYLNARIPDPDPPPPPQQHLHQQQEHYPVALELRLRSLTLSASLVKITRVAVEEQVGIVFQTRNLFLHTYRNIGNLER